MGLKISSITAANGTVGTPQNLTVNYTLTPQMDGGSVHIVSTEWVITYVDTAGTTRTLVNQAGGTTFQFSTNLGSIAPLVTNAKYITVTASAKVTAQETFSQGGTTGHIDYKANKTKNFRMTFPEASMKPTHTFSISAVNTSPSWSGYISGLSKLRITRSNNSNELKYSASISKWSVRFGNGTETNISASSTSYDSPVQGAASAPYTVSIVATLTDSRGYTVSQTLSATMVPYHAPSFDSANTKAFRSNSGGTADTSGTYIHINLKAFISACSNQNALTTLQYQYRPNSGSWGSWTNITIPSPGTSGSYDRTYTQSLTFGGGNIATSSAYEVQIKAVDTRGNTVTQSFNIPTEVWALHIINGGQGAAIGQAAQNNSRLAIPDGWKYYRGNHKVFDDGDIIPDANKPVHPLKIAFIGSMAASGADGWYKVCTVSQTGYSDCNLNLLFTFGYSWQAGGLLYVHTRCNNGTVITLDNLKWMYRYGDIEGKADQSNIYWKDNGNNTWTLYFYIERPSYGALAVQLLTETATHDSQWNLTWANNATKESSAPTGGQYATDGGISGFLAARSRQFNRLTSANQDFGNGILAYFNATSAMTTGKPPWGDGHILHFGWDNSHPKWSSQLYIRNGGYTAAMRYYNGNSQAWEDWKQIWTAADTIPAANGGTGQTSLQATRNAMGLGNTTGALPVANGGSGQTNSTSESTVGNIITTAGASSGVSIVSAHYAQWGKIAQVHITFQKSSATSSGTTSLGTLVSGKRPKIETFATLGWSINASKGKIQTDGLCQISGAIAANTSFAFRATYILA